MIFVILMVSLPLTLASETQHRFKVYVSVEGDNETITGLLTSHLKRELRALGDVDVVGYDDDWRYAIRVFYIETTKGGVKTGGLAIANIREIRLLKLFLKDEFSSIKVVAPGNLGVSYWTKDGLQEWCISEAGSFNDKYLESARSTRRN